VGLASLLRCCHWCDRSRESERSTEAVSIPRSRAVALALCGSIGSSWIECLGRSLALSSSPVTTSHPYRNKPARAAIYSRARTHTMPAHDRKHVLLLVVLVSLVATLATADDTFPTGNCTADVLGMSGLRPSKGYPNATASMSRDRPRRPRHCDSTFVGVSVRAQCAASLEQETTASRCTWAIGTLASGKAVSVRRPPCDAPTIQ